MEKINGYILLMGFFGGTRSDGYKTFLVYGRNMLQLYREGVYEINDSFFYPFHKKYVEASGEVQREKWLMITDVKELPDPFDQLADNADNDNPKEKPDELSQL
jgi:hypothetical protein